ncbi:cysteine hydrolase [Gracilibacillus oryzae]|uniref:Cysteine hydrolase n=1 Tax=Gracilibacillus oryzae TaxID=1672701 RepID=A0A7C8GT35_9BACI|nr:isochorismatase family cysteine hydrolase [Gracilibacillus oryzae]KAB8136254.1 cysteine hydrolase [Gracilibacillus oryzae]
MKKTAVMIIDMINDFNFVEGRMLLHHTKKIVPNIKKLKEFAREHDMPVIHVNDHYNTWETDYKAIAEACSRESNLDIIEQGTPAEEDYFIMKPQMSAFFRTPLRSLLEELRIEHIIMAGVAGNICVLFTANDAHMRGYTIHVPENCVASNTERHNEEALQLMKKVFNANINPI